MVAVMTPREQALLLRLLAAEIAGEARSVVVLRHTLADLGWDTARIGRAVAAITKALTGLYAQASFLERAA